MNRLTEQNCDWVYLISHLKRLNTAAWVGTDPTDSHSSGTQITPRTAGPRPRPLPPPHPPAAQGSSRGPHNAGLPYRAPVRARTAPRSRRQCDGQPEGAVRTRAGRCAVTCEDAGVAVTLDASTGLLVHWCLFAVWRSTARDPRGRGCGLKARTMQRQGNANLGCAQFESPFYLSVAAAQSCRSFLLRSSDLFRNN